MGTGKGTPSGTNSPDNHTNHDDDYNPSDVVFYDKDGTVRGDSAVTDATTASAPAAAETPPPASAEQRAAAKRLAREAVASAQEHVEGLGNLIHQKFMDMLKRRVTAKGGHLDDDDIAEMDAEFRVGMKEIETVFLTAAESFAKARERNRAESERGNAFQRLMVHTFETRLAPDAVVAREPDRLSRRILPGFFNALSLMIGPDNLSRFQKSASELADRMHRKLGDNFTWNEVYKTRESHRITLRAEILIAQHFKDMDKRVDWLVAMINSNMIPADPERPGANWSLTEDAARALLHDLFADLRTTLTKSGTHDALAREIDAKTLQVLESVIGKLRQTGTPL